MGSCYIVVTLDTFYGKLGRFDPLIQVVFNPLVGFSK